MELSLNGLKKQHDITIVHVRKCLLLWYREKKLYYHSSCKKKIIILWYRQQKT